MRSGQPSRTAQGAARHGAAHQILEGGFIFRAPLAIGILGKDAGPVVREGDSDRLRGARASAAAGSPWSACWPEPKPVGRPQARARRRGGAIAHGARRRGIPSSRFRSLPAGPRRKAVHGRPQRKFSTSVTS
jgi:hypothetical protein